MNTAWQRLKGWLGMESRANLDWMLEQSDLWKPENYDAEIMRRIMYLDNDMRPDMLALLQDEFPEHKDSMINHMLTFPFAAHVADKRARVFEGSRFELRDRASRKAVEPDSTEALTFNELLRQAQIEAVLDRADKLRDSCRSSVVLVRWDQDHVALNAYSMNGVPMVPNSDREADPYSSKAVLFERVGDEGIGDDPRYEVFATRDFETSKQVDVNGAPIFSPDMHYIASRDGFDSINQDDANPFKDAKGRAVYPFARLTDCPDAIYYPGGDTLVEFNRVLNMGFTQMQVHSSWGLLGYPVYRTEAGSNVKLPAKRPMSPKDAVQLPAGVTLEFVRNDIPVKEISDTYQLWIQMQSLLAGIDPADVKLDSTAPQSGYALKVSISGLEKRIKKLQPLMAPDVNRLLGLIVMFWNYYRKNVPGTWMVEIPPSLVPVWIPGQMEAGPVDPVELATSMPAKIQAGAATADDWVMVERGVDKSEAQKIVDANLKRNAEIAKQNTSYPAAPGAGLQNAIGLLRGRTQGGNQPPQTGQENQGNQNQGG